MHHHGGREEGLTMRPLYNLLFVVFFLLSAPFYFLKMWRRGNWAPGFGQRFGRFTTRTKQAVTNRHVIWIHAVSVGEAGLCGRMIQGLEKRLPNVKFVVSTTTSTGMESLQKQLPQHVEKIYYPVDFQPWVKRSLSTFHPEAVILVEAEVWPNFLWRVGDLGLPLFLVNARVSERSFRGYQRFHRLFRPIFASFTAVGCQNDEDAARLVQLGVEADRIFPVGSLKFDAAKPDAKPTVDARMILRRAGVPDQSRLLLGGSTHAGEEEILVNLYQRLKTRHPDLVLVLVPRHFERAQEVMSLLESRGMNYVCRTEVDHLGSKKPQSLDCLLINTTGELRHFYREADVVFVGKSLTAEGGQNPIEPAALGKAMVFGPHMENFAAIARTFVTAEGAVQVADAAGLEREIDLILSDRGHAEQLGRNALSVVERNSGALDKTVDFIVDQLEEGEVYVLSKDR